MIAGLLALALSGAPAVTYFEPAGTQCAWVRQPLEGGPKAELARVDGDCAGAAASWAAGKALLRFDTARVQASEWSGAGIPAARFPMPTPRPEAQARAYLVDLATRAVTPLPPPPQLGRLDELALDAQGRPVALLQESRKPQVVGGRPVFVVEGKPLPVPQDTEGVPALAHALRWSPERGWQRFESSVTTEGTDFALGVRALAAWKALAPRTPAQLEPHPPSDALADPALKQALAPLSPKTRADDPSGWARLQGAPVVFWQGVAEFAFATGLVRALVAGKPVELPGLDFTAGDLVALQARSGYLLVAINGTGAHPRVYRLADRKPLLRSDTALGATLDGP